jgi:hypothetical protein
MGKSHSQKGIENWPTWKVLLVTWGSMIMFFVLLLLMVSTSSTFLGYVVYSLYIMLGLAMVIKAGTIGTALFEGNRRMLIFVNLQMLRFLWHRIFMMREDTVRKRLDEMESGPLGLKFHIVITFIIGLWLIGYSVMFIVWLSNGSLFE